MGGIGSHQSPVMQTDEWLTPPEMLKALGPFDLDPCAPVQRPWNMARTHYTVLEDGLKQPWTGRVWLNPPYCRETGKWLERMAQHGNGIALVFARTETRMFFEHVWPYASGVLFIEGRLHFHYPDGTRARANSGGPSILIAYGADNAEALKRWSGIKGKYLDIIE